VTRLPDGSCLRRIGNAAMVLAVAGLANFVDPICEAASGADEGFNSFEENGDSSNIEQLRGRAQDGNREAQYRLGLLYLKGAGLPRDASQAASWFYLAAVTGHAESQMTLGNMYWVGNGVERDLGEAYKLFSMALAGLPPGALRNEALANRDSVAAHFSRDQMTQYLFQALKWRPAPAHIAGHRTPEGGGQLSDMTASEAGPAGAPQSTVGESQNLEEIETLANERKMDTAASSDASWAAESPAQVVDKGDVSSALSTADLSTGGIDSFGEINPSDKELAISAVRTERSEAESRDLRLKDPPSESMPVKIETFRTSEKSLSQTASQLALSESATTSSTVVGEVATANTKKKVFYVQVGSVISEPLAQTELTRLRSLHRELIEPKRTVIQRAEVAGKGTVFRIRLGPYETKSDAVLRCDQLRKRNQDCFVVRG